MYVTTVMECDLCHARSDPFPSDSQWNHIPAGWLSNFGIDVITPMGSHGCMIRHLCPVCANLPITEVIRRSLANVSN